MVYLIPSGQGQGHSKVNFHLTNGNAFLPRILKELDVLRSHMVWPMDQMWQELAKKNIKGLQYPDVPKLIKPVERNL